MYAHELPLDVNFKVSMDYAGQSNSNEYMCRHIDSNITYYDPSLTTILRFSS